MSDCFTAEQRSQIMSRIRSRGNRSTELRMVDMLKRHKVSGWRRGSLLPGKPDFLFPGFRLAVFVDGDFWHGHPAKKRIPGTNSDYWREKILSNKRKDRRTNRLLRAAGWTVLRFWESSLRDEPATIARLKKALRNMDRRRSRVGPGGKRRLV